MDEQKPAVPDRKNFCFALPAAAVPLVHEVRCPDVVVAPDEVDPGPGLPGPVQGLKKGIVTIQPEMGIIEPEIEDVPEQDQVVCLAGQIHEPAEFPDPLFFGGIGYQMEVGIGHEEGRRLPS